MPKRKPGRPGSYEIHGTIARDSTDGTSYNDTIFYAEKASDDQDAVNQWKSTLAKGVRIVKYTVIFLGGYVALLVLQQLLGGM